MGIRTCVQVPTGAGHIRYPGTGVTDGSELSISGATNSDRLQEQYILPAAEPRPKTSILHPPPGPKSKWPLYEAVPFHPCI